MEKSVNEYNNDASKHGGYIYSLNRHSSKIATKRQTDEIIYLIKKYFFQKKIKILDLGCGDGEFTMKIYNQIKPDLVLGIDNSKKGIEIATKKSKNEDKKRIKFEVANVYNLAKYKHYGFDLVVIRGVIHHLYKPRQVIKELNKISDYVLILEPNGYNLILKIIENTSEYHKRHEEKSYFPFQINSWFSKNGYAVVEQKIFGLVPYFCGESLANFLKLIEPLFEKYSILRDLCTGSNVALYKNTRIKKF